jgi:hypothetical protein
VKIETYGQRYRIKWEAFMGNVSVASGTLLVRPTKPKVLRGIPVKIRAQAMMAADKHLRSNNLTYARAKGRALHITPLED